LQRSRWIRRSAKLECKTILSAIVGSMRCLSMHLRRPTFATFPSSSLALLHPPVSLPPFLPLTRALVLHCDLKSACLSGENDHLNAPSSRLVLGRPIASGTGAFDLFQPLHY
jgi:hypothetical protein